MKEKKNWALKSHLPRRVWPRKIIKHSNGNWIKIQTQISTWIDVNRIQFFLSSSFSSIFFFLFPSHFNFLPFLSLVFFFILNFLFRFFFHSEMQSIKTCDDPISMRSNWACKIEKKRGRARERERERKWSESIIKKYVKKRKIWRQNLKKNEEK